MKNLVKKRNPKNYWTKERCHEEALKYNTRSEFNKGSVSAYSKAWDCGWLDDICDHMIILGNKYNRCIYSYEFEDKHVYVGLTYNFKKRSNQHNKRGPVRRHILKTGNLPTFRILTGYISKETAIIKEEEFLIFYINNGWTALNSVKTGALGGGKLKWSKDKCKEEALKYTNIKEYRNNLSYKAAVRNNWLDEICSHMNRTKNKFNYWTKEKCAECAMLCNSRKEFSERFPGGYESSRKNKWLDEICKHIKYKEKKPKGYWTKERCQIESMKYKNRGDFQKSSRSAYQISSRNGWLDDICGHMINI